MVNMEPYALANSRQPALLIGRSEPDLLQRLHPLSTTRRTEPCFEPAGSAFQRGPGVFGPLCKATLSPYNSVSTLGRGKPSSGPHPEPGCRWSHVRGNDSCGGQRGDATRPELLHPATAGHFRARRAAIRSAPARQPFIHFNASRSSTRGAQPFPLIEHVKRLLQQQKIRDARHALELGSIWYPESRQVAKLLQAISPGRASPTDHVTNGRERETVWIRQHGHKYRGQWIALDEDHLIAFESTLKGLLAKIVSEHERARSPFVQYLVPE